jgi:hypothetical protein
VVTLRRLAVAVGVASLVVLGAVRHAEAHPLHTTITELVLDPARGTVQATVRIFVDDLRTALARTAKGRSLRPTDPGWDDAVVTYVASTVALRDARGRALPLRTCGTRRLGDALSLCLQANVPHDAGELQIRNAMLCELYDDQINVVQNLVGGSRRSLLFTRGDPFKTLR